MDLFISQLITMLNQRKEPAVLVLYGDHLPGFEWTEKEMKNRSLFQTPYVIWNNLDLPREKRDIESYQLTSHVLNLINIHEGTMIRFHQRHLERGDSKTQACLDDMKILEYDILYGNRRCTGEALLIRKQKLEYGPGQLFRSLPCVREIRLLYLVWALMSGRKFVWTESRWTPTFMITG